MSETVKSNPAKTMSNHVAGIAVLGVLSLLAAKLLANALGLNPHPFEYAFVGASVVISGTVVGRYWFRKLKQSGVI